MCRQGSGLHQAYSIDVVMIVLHAVILRPPPFFACVLQEHVWRRSSTSTHTWRGSLVGWAQKANFKKKKYNLNLHVSVVCEVGTSQCAGKRNCWSIAVRFRDESYTTMCQIYESTNKSFLLNCIFALLSFGLVFNGCVTVSLKKKAKPNNLHV